MSTGVIVAIVIAATGMLLMRFRKRWRARFNIAVTNRMTSLFAGWLSGFGILINPFAARKTFTGARWSFPDLKSEWVKNLIAAGGCELKTRGKKYQLSAPNVVRDPTRRRFPIPVRVVLRLVGADEYMELSMR